MSRHKGDATSVLARFGERFGLVQKLVITIPPANNRTRPINHTRGAGQINHSKAKKEPNMSLDISKLSEIKGLLGACLVDSDTGLTLGTEGGSKFDLDTAGAANVEVVRAKLQAIEALKLNDTIEDILITLGKQFHLVRPLDNNPNIFVYVALDKKTANLGLARLQVKAVEETLSL
ncbi:roadblock/LC7 domain-containing protein [Ruegeria sp. R13_0]|uniref:roadblock/LC7 domain-containing protein n=1 Tax=Ruegeria sp. R13_0 TaxID=2821099 RepID=UPI001ADD1DCF|nr:roadblock/LC7 domain-containing protein [Ruegeria sp. R13_0]MBO9434064.1 roadblock/LC7 domain-containing protein [Ruegeria sp. R13_0]